MDSREMAGRVAIVTGAGSGIGRGGALAFAGAGAHVVVADVDADGGEETVALVRDAGGEAIFALVDVAVGEHVERMVTTAREHYGRLDYAMNNAGIQGPLTDTADYTEEEWERTIAVNLTGVWLCMKHELQEIGRAGGGAIVNVASNFGLVAAPGMAAYAASKHGVVGLTKVAGLEYAQRGIRVNAICPGGTETGMITKTLERDAVAGQKMLDEVKALHPIGRWAQPSEIAAAAVWLCSERASFVTATILPVDGGYVAR
jgi:NAD(P)-dependent dehydrogenase (short-subunit alcohol dehydrogenase family)